MADYNEAYLGDLSDNFQDPTAHEFELFQGELVLFTGSNVVEGSTLGGGNPPGDRDFFTFTVPTGFKVKNLILRDYKWGDNNTGGDSYFALTRGDRFVAIDSTHDARSYEISKLIDDLDSNSEVGKNLLDASVGDATRGDKAGTAAGELGPGTYSVWYQETGADTTYAFDVQLEAPAGADFGQVQFDPDSFSVNEGDGTFDIDLTRTGGSDGAVSVLLRRTGGTAQNFSDINFRPATVIFKDGETEKTVTRALIDDTAIEPTETVTFELDNPSGGVTLGANRTATLSIIDNDTPLEPGQLQFSTNAFSVNEDAGTFDLQVNRVGGSDGTISADLNLVGGSAANGSDFVFSDINVSFANGVTSRAFSFDLTDDAIAEDDETAIFELRPLGDSSGLAIPPNSTTLTIVDNDAPVGDADQIIVAMPGESPLYGGSGNDLIIGTTGDDDLFGNEGDDIIKGELDNTSSVGGGDSLFGGDGRDQLFGGAGTDVLFGGAGDDQIWGDAGNDYIVGGIGNDFLTGDRADGLGGGSDIFVLGLGEGTDIILDFEAGIDAIGLTGGLSFGQLYVVQSGADTAIGSYSTGEVLAVLTNTTASGLTEPAFLSV